jgi:hypothetical protein
MTFANDAPTFIAAWIPEPSTVGFVNAVAGGCGSNCRCISGVVLVAASREDHALTRADLDVLAAGDQLRARYAPAPLHERDDSGVERELDARGEARGEQATRRRAAPADHAAAPPLLDQLPVPVGDPAVATPVLDLAPRHGDVGVVRRELRLGAPLRRKLDGTLEDGGADIAALEQPAFLLGVVVGIPRDPLEGDSLRFVEAQRLVAALEVRVSDGGHRLAPIEPRHVAARELDRVLDAVLGSVVVRRDPDQAARVRVGTAEPVRALDDEHSRATGCSAQRRGQAAAAAGDDDVVLLVRHLRLPRCAPHQRRTSAVVS